MATKTKMQVSPLAAVENKLGKQIALRYNKSKTTTLDWDSEKRYAIQLMMANDFLKETALANPDSVATSMLDLARLGLSLSPATGHAYLIPRRVNKEPTVFGVPSYRGLISVVLRSGLIKAVTSDVVYKSDDFVMWTDDAGLHVKHVHARGDRGAFEGAYTRAVFANGEVVIEYMSADDIEACKQAALRQNNDKLPPSWKFFFGEQAKKCSVRRAWKRWPHDQHIQMAMESMAKAEPMEFGDEARNAEGPAEVCVGDAEIETIRDAMEGLEPEVIDHWMLKVSEAMGFTAITDIPISKVDDVISRLVARAEKLGKKVKGTTNPAVAA